MGSRVARELLQHDYAVICPVRDSQTVAAKALDAFAASNNRGRLTLCPVNLQDSADLNDALKAFQVDSIVSCIASRSGGVKDSHAVDYLANHALLEWALGNNVRHFTLLSAICIQKPRLAFQFAKLKFENELAASGIAYTSVRATAFFKSLSGQLKRVREGKPFLMFGDGTLTRCKPIAEADLATFIRLSLESKNLRGIQAIGGPGPAITPLEQAQLLAQVTEQPLRTRSISPKLLKAIAAILGVPARLSQRLADKAEFARIGHYYATESMLLWNAATESYDADATPEFGTITLEESYRAQLAGIEDQGLGDQAVFR
ncbi:NAD(P)H-binding protein [Congregibacter brevis]|uniref:Divinyl chlorophyllide a 8-vinyl-reductase, chloroplastic n=1 Tax=Congregibacter brevis TaxID=3081201 RepID=A0ABZ0IJI4_9GAMM|nr:NAD(P)H-binding protein [Congregibacter sp. IMCC45268]